jgi:hypothetical protein
MPNEKPPHVVNGQSIFFPGVKYFAPHRAFQPLPEFDNGEMLENAPTFPTMAHAAYALILFYLHADLPESAARIESIERPKGNEQNAQAKLSLLKPEHKQAVEAEMRKWFQTQKVVTTIRDNKIRMGLLPEPKVEPKAEPKKELAKAGK